MRWQRCGQYVRKFVAKTVTVALTLPTRHSIADAWGGIEVETNSIPGACTSTSSPCISVRTPIERGADRRIRLDDAKPGVYGAMSTIQASQPRAGDPVTTPVEPRSGGSVARVESGRAM